jgi:hypothetical protein
MLEMTHRVVASLIASAERRELAPRIAGRICSLYIAMPYQGICRYDLLTKLRN